MEADKWNQPQTKSNERLGKKMAYLLRYGAEKEGLIIDENGFVDLNQLIQVRLLSVHTKEEIMNEIAISVSSVRKLKRFEAKEDTYGNVFVKATYGHRLQRNPFHEGSNVKRLLVSTVDAMCTLIDKYDFEFFPDNYILGIIIRRLKEKSLLTNKTLRHLMVPALSHLDLYSTYLNEGTLKLIPKQCPNLKWLSFRSCGYIITDHLLPQVLKGLPILESLNLHGCHHLTDKSLTTIQKCCKNLKHLNLTFVKNISPSAIINLVDELGNLEELHIYDLKDFESEDVSKLFDVTKGRKFHLESAHCSDQNEQIFDSPWERPNFR